MSFNMSGWTPLSLPETTQDLGAQPSTERNRRVGSPELDAHLKNLSRFEELLSKHTLTFKEIKELKELSERVDEKMNYAMIGLNDKGLEEEEQLDGSKIVCQEMRSFIEEFRSRSHSKMKIQEKDAAEFLRRARVKCLKFLKAVGGKSTHWNKIDDNETFDVLIYEDRTHQKILVRQFSGYLGNRLDSGSRKRKHKGKEEYNENDTKPPAVRTVSFEDEHDLMRKMIENCVHVNDFKRVFTNSIFRDCWERLQRFFANGRPSSGMSEEQVIEFRQNRSEVWAQRYRAQDASAKELLRDLETVFCMLDHISQKLCNFDSGFKNELLESPFICPFCRMVLYCVALKRAETLCCLYNDRTLRFGKIWCDGTEYGKLERIGANLFGIYFTVSPSKEVFRKLAQALPSELEVPLEHLMKPALPRGMYDEEVLAKALANGFVLHEDDAKLLVRA